MSLLDRAQGFLRRFRGNDEPSEESMYSRRHDGSLSGYHPNVGRMAPSQEAAAPVDAAYDPYAQPPSWAQEPMVGQSAPMAQPADMTGFGQQQGYQHLWNHPEQATWQSATEFQGTYQPQFQNPPANQPGSPFVGYQPTFQQPQPAQPQPPVPDNISYMPGGIVGKDGREYLHTVRVGQITGVPDCYALMQCMRNNETVVVNLDLVPDPTEIDRCLDLLFGASYALQCKFHRISSRNLYLLTPATVQVETAENLRHRTEYEAENRWPDPGNLGYRPQTAYGFQNGYGGYGQNNGGMNDQSFGGIGRRSGHRSTAVEYTDFGGFPNAGRF